MDKNIINTIKRLKTDTNNNEDIVYRYIKKGTNDIVLVYSSSLVAGDKVSDFVTKSIYQIISNKYLKASEIFDSIKNNIYSFKVLAVTSYEDLCNYLNNGFTIILIDGISEALALETKAPLDRSIGEPSTENSILGSKDSFVENFEKNTGLIKRRIKDNNLWMQELKIGRYTKTKIRIFSINGIVEAQTIENVVKEIENVDIDGIISSGDLKDILLKTSSRFPTALMTERPDTASRALLQGKVVIVVENNPFVIILPTVLNDFFKSPEDHDQRSLSVTYIRIIKYIAFFITLLAPGVYIAMTTYNQEMIPSELLISFAIQRDGVPFPAFFEAFMMLIAFEILRQSDIRVPSTAGGALSIVGALILGEAAVSAGIVSPIMIIVIAITSISSLIFSDYDFIKTISNYRILFMLGASLLGMVGLLIVFIFFLIRVSSLKSFGKPFLIPFSPFEMSGFKNSIIKVSNRSLRKRNSYFTKNIVRERIKNDEKN